MFAAIAAVLLPILGTQLAWSQSLPVAGDEFAITRSYETASKTSDGSTGSSHGHDTVIERVIAVSDASVELEYDLSADTSAEDRSRQWQFPLRVLLSPGGSMQLLNRNDMEKRLDEWLKAAKLTRELCGRWYFTWNAFKIECDPQSALQAMEAIDLRSVQLREGAPYQMAGVLRPGTLTRKVADSSGEKYMATLQVDPEAVRRQRAEADVVVGEIMQKPVSLEEALRKRAEEEISGTISVRFETDGHGNPLRRIKVTELETTRPDGTTESETMTETVERRRTLRN